MPILQENLISLGSDEFCEKLHSKFKIDCNQILSWEAGEPEFARMPVSKCFTIGQKVFWFWFKEEGQQHFKNALQSMSDPMDSIANGVLPLVMLPEHFDKVHVVGVEQARNMDAGGMVRWLGAEWMRAVVGGMRGVWWLGRWVRWIA